MNKASEQTNKKQINKIGVPAFHLHSIYPTSAVSRILSWIGPGLGLEDQGPAVGLVLNIANIGTASSPQLAQVR